MNKITLNINDDKILKNKINKLLFSRYCELKLDNYLAQSQCLEFLQ